MQFDRTKLLKMYRTKNNLDRETLRKRLLHVKGDPLAHVIIIVEDHFRPLEFRIVEYLVFLMLLIFRFERATKMTLGMNQLRADRWIEHLHSDGCMPSIVKIVLAGENLNRAANATKWFLDKNKFEANDNSISAFYTGRRNEYYDGLVQEGLEVANFMNFSAKSH